MVNIKAIALVLLVLPAIIIAASSCTVSVSSTQTATSSKYTTYSATATNTGSSTVTNVVLTPSATLKSMDGLSASSSGNSYSISSLKAGSSKTFTYRVKSGTTVTWTSQCSGSSSSGTTTHAPKETTKAPSTAAPTSKSTTAAPTSKSSTSAPTTKSSTSAPTQKPAAGGRICPTGSWWAPSPLTTWQWQLTGTIDTSLNVQMYDIDLYDASTEVISTLHSQGKVVICYFSTQYENWRPDASDFTAAVKGNGLDGWAGENYVDIRSPIVRNIMNSRLDLAVSKGCDGVEPDNVDGYTASSGFPLTAADQIDFNTYIANQAHARGLSVGLKNDVSQAKTLQPVFDWALNEQCYQYSECATLNSFVTAGKPVFNTEYSGSGSTVCPYMNNLKFSSLIKTLDLTASIKAQCCTYQNPSCAPAPYTCKTASSAREVRSVEEQVIEEITEFSPEEVTASASTTYASVFVVAVVLSALNF